MPRLFYDGSWSYLGQRKIWLAACKYLRTPEQLIRLLVALELFLRGHRCKGAEEAVHDGPERHQLPLHRITDTMACSRPQDPLRRAKTEIFSYQMLASIDLHA